MFGVIRLSVRIRNEGREHGREWALGHARARMHTLARWRRARRQLVRLAVAGSLGTLVLVTCGGAAAALVGVRRGTRRVVVEGRSMLPSFEPGDRLLVVRLPRRWPLRRGDVVAVPDPRQPGRLLVKRVEATSSRLVTVVGDNPAESTDSRIFGPVDRAAVWGRACYRYAPRARSGVVRRSAP
jgi:nickel-type superoxide dismutase maturation protease